jgi:outer membrane lipoprotein-sorting protein
MTTGNKASRARSFALAFTLSTVVCSLAYSVAANAAEPPSNPAWGIEQLMQRLAQVKTVKATFVERKDLRILNAPLEFSGTLFYSAPGHLEKHTLLPKPQSLILDEDRLTIEDQAKKQRRNLMLQDYPVIWAFVESIRSTLAGDLQALSRFYRVELEGGENQWRLVLKPSEPKMHSLVSEIRISGARSRIRTIDVMEAGGDRSVMTITEDAR